ncbi:hypothetical protein [Halalkalicoccus jeotgali]|uniref:DUF8048 domain-containing protein n=1 Tax=Halalkalicoccus jeotgali (strain DSM 18796 / CECT 7217 / JCM 14584 / KCTC 4019 / B3) TaxID=795797 RepID=D8J6D2_HALJB|nr:hypothetical protein [Halalkalicoccus jeotgali]ADJ15850.1 hypothetical protein HacjB3_12335 [Halalkalicoccus jeotgali B3]ELY37946.1 hypothetical protein C497_07529 [Halalkalicoccus jeotgali B3]
MTDDTARTTAIETDIVARTAEDSGVDEGELADALELLDADLRGRHSEFEQGEYVTVEDRRAYAIDPEEWESLFEPYDFDDALETAARRAHERQAEALFVASSGDSDALAGSGVVCGIDTAEQFD